MASKLPYIVQPPILPKILLKIQQTATPEQFTQEFLSRKLGFKGGNHRQFIPLAKKLGLLDANAVPTDRYRAFKISSQSRSAMATAVRTAYRELFKRNEDVHTASKDELKALVIKIAGLDAKDRVVQLICQTFEELKKASDFEAKNASTPPAAVESVTALREAVGDRPERDFGLNLAYTINLVLPKSDDPAVFNAVFKALNDNLLRK